MAGEIPLDDDGQPINFGICARKRQDRTVDELLGIAKAMVADGKVSEEEAGFLCQWLGNNARNAPNVWPMNIINDRVQEMLSHGGIGEQERRQLCDLLKNLVGGAISVTERVASFSSILPLDDPPPVIEFEWKNFCFTGAFAFGPRTKCAEEVERRGGRVEEKVLCNGLDYLVVGIASSRDWAHSTFGRKIEKAVELRKEGRGVAIIGEDHWTQALLSEPLAGWTFLFLGELSGITCDEAMELVQSMGGIAAKNVTRTVDYVVAGMSPGPRLEKAKAYGLKIIDQAEFDRLTRR